MQGVQAHAVTLTDSFMQSGGVRLAKDYKLDAMVNELGEMTTSDPLGPHVMATSGRWEDIDYQTENHLCEMAGVLKSLKGEYRAGFKAEGIRDIVHQR